MLKMTGLCPQDQFVSSCEYKMKISYVGVPYHLGDFRVFALRRVKKIIKK